jgi:hypothetical protein
MLTPGIFCFIAAAIVFVIGLLTPPQKDAIKRWWRWRMRIGGIVGMIIGLILIIVGVTGD